MATTLVEVLQVEREGLGQLMDTLRDLTILRTGVTGIRIGTMTIRVSLIMVQEDTERHMEWVGSIHTVHHIIIALLESVMEAVQAMANTVSSRASSNMNPSKRISML